MYHTVHTRIFYWMNFVPGSLACYVATSPLFLGRRILIRWQADELTRFYFLESARRPERTPRVRVPQPLHSAPQNAQLVLVQRRPLSSPTP